MTGGAWRAAILGLAVTGVALAYLGAEVGRLIGEEREAYYTDMAVVALGVVALWAAFARLGRHFRDLERLREELSGARGRTAIGVGGGTDARNDEAGRLAKAAADALRRQQRATASDDRLSAVVSALEEPVVVLDDLGRVEVLNAAASGVLGIAAGDDIYDHLSRPELFRAIERAREDGRMVSAVLRRAQGAEVSVRVKDLGLQAGIALVVPARGPGQSPLLTGDRVVMRPTAKATHLGDEEPLMTLPLVSLWVATTTGRLEEGAVVAVGTVRMAGPRVFRTLCLDLYVDPGTPIPPEATARHGVTTAMVEGARPFADAWPVIAEALHGCVVVGVGVDAALDALARHCAQAGLPEPERPPALDLGRLAAALEPSLEGAPLERLADAFGMAGHHHRADVFAPALTEAELAAALLLRLDERGVATHGAARALAGDASIGAGPGIAQ
ncbi:exonuclease domain-containing protein [Azospirillum sp. sgz302134]